MTARRVDGILISPSSETDDLSYLRDLHDKGMPIVFFDRISDQIETHTVTANNYQGAFHATEHLIFEGYKKIAHITSAPFLSITQERLEGYKDALAKHDIPYNDSLVKYCSHGGMILAELEEAINGLFNAKARPDAIFAAGDRLTIMCFGLLKTIKFRKDLGFMGFTNTQVGDLFYPTLTVIRQPAFEIGQTAIEYLIQIIESKRPVTQFEKKVLDTELIIRQSSKGMS